MLYLFPEDITKVHNLCSILLVVPPHYCAEKGYTCVLPYPLIVFHAYDEHCTNQAYALLPKMLYHSLRNISLGF